MGYYDNEQNVLEYIEMAEGFDGRELVEKLGAYLPEGATVLELGMGPGVDWNCSAGGTEPPVRTRRRSFSAGTGQSILMQICSTLMR